MSAWLDCANCGSRNTILDPEAFRNDEPAIVCEGFRGESRIVSQE